MSSVIDTALLTPEDLYSQARGFGVDLDREPYLLPLMKQAATTPKPPKRQQNDGGNDGESYFLDQIKLLRQQVANGKQEEETSAWMAFEEVISPEVGNAATKKYYYDFISKTRR